MKLLTEQSIRNGKENNTIDRKILKNFQKKNVCLLFGKVNILYCKGIKSNKCTHNMKKVKRTKIITNITVLSMEI